MISCSASLSSMKLTEQLTCSQHERLQSIANCRKCRLETVRLFYVEPSLGVVGVQKVAKKQPVKVVEVVQSVVTLALTSGALQQTKVSISSAAGPTALDFKANNVKMVEGRPIVSATKMWPSKSSFGNI